VRALGHVLGALAAASDWHAVAMIAAPVPDGSMLFIGPTKHPVLLGAVARVTGMLIDPRVSVVGGEVADA
jgi:hypothetical protein